MGGYSRSRVRKSWDCHQVKADIGRGIWLRELTFSDWLEMEGEDSLAQGLFMVNSRTDRRTSLLRTGSFNNKNCANDRRDSRD